MVILMGLNGLVSKNHTHGRQKVEGIRQEKEMV